MVDDAYRARVCSNHRKEYSLWPEFAPLSRCKPPMETPRRKKEQTIEVSISDRDEIAKAADIKRVITRVDSADDGGEVQRLH